MPRPSAQRARDPRWFGVILASVVLALAGTPAEAGNGNALDPARYHYDGVYQLRVHSYEPAIRAIKSRSGIWGISFDTMLAGRRGLTYSCGERCRTWTSTLNNHDRWFPQGLAGSRESRWGNAPSAEVIVSSWYKKRSADDSTAVASTLKFISRSDWKYRNVRLRVPIWTSDGWRSKPLGSHVGGIAWAGRFLYVADTWGLYRFDLSQILATKNGAFLLPDRRYSGIDKNPYHRARISSVSTDWSGTPSLVTAEYTTSGTAEVVRWPITDRGGLKSSNGKVSSTYNFWIDKDSSIDRVQGVEAHKGVYFFASGKGTLHRARVGTQRDRASYRWGEEWVGYWDSDIPEDLYAVPGHRMYGQTEERTDRYIMWRSMPGLMP